MAPTVAWLVFDRFQTFLSQSSRRLALLSWESVSELAKFEDEEQRASSVGELTALQAAGVLIS